MNLTGQSRIQREPGLFFPVKILPSHGHLPVPFLSTLHPFNYIAGMSGNTRGNYSLPYILRLRQAKVLRRRYVAEKIGTGGSSNSPTYSPSNVVITSTDIGYQRAENIEGSPLADRFL